MVLFGTFYSGSASSGCRGLQKGLKIEALNKLITENIFFKLCKGCQVNTMAAIPPSAFSAARIRETQRDKNMKLSKIDKGGEPSKFFSNASMELSPQKYNNKLMNSIWGFYNRYSPHNVKKVTDAHSFDAELKPTVANSVNKTYEQKITLPSANLDNVWAAMNISPSH